MLLGFTQQTEDVNIYLQFLSLEVSRDRHQMRGTMSKPKIRKIIPRERVENAVRFTFNLPAPTLAALEKEANTRKVTTSSVARDAVTFWLLQSGAKS